MKHWWSMEDVRYLVDSAGKLPLEDICAALGKSKNAVESAAKRLRKLGVDVKRLEVRRAFVCPTCGERRDRIGKLSGICRVCELDRLLSQAEREMAEVLQHLPAGIRENYRNSEVLRGSKRDTTLKGEDAEIAYLARQYKAARRRVERARKKL